MNTNLSFSPPSDVATGLLAVFAVDAAPKAAARPEVRLLAPDDAPAKAAQSILDTGEFKAESCETLLLHNPAGLQAKRLLIVGLGKAAKLTPHEVRKAAATAARFAKPRGLREIAIAVPIGDALDPKLTVRALTEGALLGDFDSDTYRSDRKDRSVQTVQVVAPASSDRATAEAALREGVIVAESQNFARALINEPGNRLTPTILGQRAAEMCRTFGIQCQVHGTEKMRELEMGAFLSVTQGSDEPPALIVMTYEPKGAPVSPVLGLVGKGITFDTGGISIKPSDNMEKMKYDMAGGAAMIGAMRAIAQLQPAVKVIGIVCAAENMPSGKAQKPGDVQIAMPAPGKPGKAIEIINTDAEGRLVLADGITYAKQLGATHLIDAATLTGAVAVALGQLNAGIFANDEDSYHRFTQGLNVSGEHFWRLPLDDDYRDVIKSSIADIKNTGGRYGGAINAAMFLREFAEDTPWLHLDIA
ncbi:MAG TPA: leucyl aminopeptidase, partial [Acidobacteriaceae bacterium]|nr:leucyl aminopeptidase [Acidobacteriaceae bacterium]